MPTTRIFLTGYMGSGKTTTGEITAGLLGYAFVDLDKEIEKLEGCPVHEIFETKGEPIFRLIERRALMEAAASDNIVIATGGGCPAFENNMQWMNENGTTVYLRCHPGVLFHRLAPEKKGRPLLSRLSDLELMGYISAHLEERGPVYEKAIIKVNAEQTPDQVAKAIMEQLRR